LMILVTCLIASFATESGGRKMAIAEENRELPKPGLPQRIMVPISNPQTIEKLMDLSILIKDPSLPEPIYPLNIIKDDADADAHILRSRKMLEQALKHAAAAGVRVQLITRVDLNIPSGILRAAKEMQITSIIIGWNAQITTREKIFGSVLDNILHSSSQTLLVCKLLYGINTFQKIRLFIPALAHYEPGFSSWFQMIRVLTQQAGTSLEIMATGDTIEHIRKIIPVQRPYISPGLFIDNSIPDLKKLARTANSGELFIFISARRTNISYQSYLDNVPYDLSRRFQNQSFIVIYPEQSSKGEYSTNLQLDDYSVFSYQKKISFFSQTLLKIKDFLNFGK